MSDDTDTDLIELLHDYAALEKHSRGASACMVQAAAEIERLRNFETAFNEWMAKTEWVQEKSDWSFRTLGLHRADVMRLEIERLMRRLATIRDLTVEPHRAL